MFAHRARFLRAGNQRGWGLCGNHGARPAAVGFPCRLPEAVRASPVPARPRSRALRARP
jgi:hypothetical protein